MGQLVSHSEIVRKLKLNDKIHFHTLRHRFESMPVQKGVSLYVVKNTLSLSINYIEISVFFE